MIPFVKIIRSAGGGGDLWEGKGSLDTMDCRGKEIRELLDPFSIQNEYEN